MAIPVQSSIAPPTGFNSVFYTPGGVILFSYMNDTYFVVKASSGDVFWNGTLDEGTIKHLTLSAGTFSVETSKPYTLIVGEPETQSVVGYFALDPAGSGTSRELYTYIPPPDPLYADAKFIIFAYENDTVVTATVAETQTILWQGTLNRSQHFSQDLSNVTWQNKTVHIESSDPVSVLCYLDQGFAVPSSTGLFTGTLFYTFAGNITNGNNDLNVIGHNDNTWVTISTTDSEALVWNGTVNSGEVHSEVFADPMYLTIESNQSVAVTVDPYPTWPIMYQAALYTPDSDGNFIGRQFFTTARGGGTLRILAYENDANVNITDQSTSTLIWKGTLNKMEFYERTTSHTVYKITSDKSISVLEGYGGWSAMFAPSYYTTDTQPPTIGTPIHIPQNPTATQDVQITADVIDDISGVQRVILSYSDDTLWHNITMTWSEGNTYTANVTTLASQTQLEYKLIAYDNVNNTATSSQTTLTITPQPSPSPSPSPSPTPSPSPAPSPSPMPSPSPSPTASPSPVPSASPSPSSPPFKPFWTEPFSVLLIVAVVVATALTALGLRLYFKKRKE